jgi:hypothetical protein
MNKKEKEIKLELGLKRSEKTRTNLKERLTLRSA